MIRLPPDFKEFLRLLHSHHVEYLLVGGYAVGYHGFPRATVDMDLWIAIHPGNAEKMATVVRDFGINVPQLSPELFLKEKQVIRMGEPPFRIEILTTISGVEFRECYEKRIKDRIDGVEVNIIDLEHLKKNKKVAGRHKDLSDLEQIP